MLRFTKDDANRVLDTHKLTLIRGNYGVPNSMDGCPLTLIAVRHFGDVAKAKAFVRENLGTLHQSLATLVGTTEPYLTGLERGFEGLINGQSRPEDRTIGFADGEAIASLLPKTVSVTKTKKRGKDGL